MLSRWLRNMGMLWGSSFWCLMPSILTRCFLTPKMVFSIFLKDPDQGKAFYIMLRLLIIIIKNKNFYILLRKSERLTYFFHLASVVGLILKQFWSVKCGGLTTAKGVDMGPCWVLKSFKWLNGFCQHQGCCHMMSRGLSKVEVSPQISAVMDFCRHGA